MYKSGFTLLEVLIVMVILGILLTLAAPSFQTMVVNQRLRTVTSDLNSDLALARIEAIKRSSRVGLARTNATWSGGWRVFHDVSRNGVFNPETDGNGICDAGEECILIARQAVHDSVKVCSSGDAFDVLSFGADGAVRAFVNGTAVAVAGVTISSGADLAGVPARRLEFGPSGRLSVVTAGVAACP